MKGLFESLGTCDSVGEARTTMVRSSTKAKRCSPRPEAPHQGARIMLRTAGATGSPWGNPRKGRIGGEGTLPRHNAALCQARTRTEATEMGRESTEVRLPKIEIRDVLAREVSSHSW